jgi:AbrB family looped-hinge helix DNA binding protein
MNTLVTKVTERGQVSIPASVRAYLNLQPGMGLLWNTSSDRYSCTITIVRKHRPKGARAMLGYAATFRAPRTTAEWMKELREGEKP